MKFATAQECVEQTLLFFGLTLSSPQAPPEEGYRVSSPLASMEGEWHGRYCLAAAFPREVVFRISVTDSGGQLVGEGTDIFGKSVLTGENEGEVARWRLVYQALRFPTLPLGGVRPDVMLFDAVRVDNVLVGSWTGSGGGFFVLARRPLLIAQPLLRRLRPFVFFAMPFYVIPLLLIVLCGTLLEWPAVMQATLRGAVGLALLHAVPAMLMHRDLEKNREGFSKSWAALRPTLGREEADERNMGGLQPDESEMAQDGKEAPHRFIQSK